MTYADGPYEANLRLNAWFARIFMRCGRICTFQRCDLEADPIYLSHRTVFDQKRGAGYWAWKPWAILRAMDEAAEGDVIIYQDCGFGLRYKSFLYPRSLLALTKMNGFIAGVRVPQYGPHRRWTHKACLDAMAISDPADLNGPQVEAVVSFWTVSEQSKTFLREWLGYCLDPIVVGDALPSSIPDQDPEFIEHRYDQAILTNLVNKQSAFALEPSAAVMPIAKSVSALEIDTRARARKWSGIVLLKLLLTLQCWRERSVPCVDDLVANCAKCSDDGQGPQPSSNNANGSNDRPLNIDAYNTASSRPNIKPQTRPTLR